MENEPILGVGGNIFLTGSSPVVYKIDNTLFLFILSNNNMIYKLNGVNLVS